MLCAVFFGDVVAVGCDGDRVLEGSSRDGGVALGHVIGRTPCRALRL